MVSIFIPSTIKLFIAPGYLKRVGPLGSFLKKTGQLQFFIMDTFAGSRLFVKGNSQSEEATVLSLIAQQVSGLSRGYRSRVRLVGIGFRAAIRPYFPETLNHITNRPNFRRKRLISSPYSNSKKRANQIKVLSLKIGYSHESLYPVLPKSNLNFQVARLDGRSKGTIVSVQGSSKEEVSQTITELRSFRIPDVYKAKGIHYFNEKITLKKGKRQGLSKLFILT